MSSEGSELVVTVNGRQAIALGILTLIVAGSVISYIIALFAFISPNQDLRWTTSIDEFNYFGAVRTQFSPGEQVTIIGDITEGTQYFVPPSNYYSFSGSVDVRWIVTVIGPNNLPVDIQTGTTSLTDSPLYPTVSFDLPNDAETGFYYARVLIWTDWLPSGKSMTYDVTAISFEVV